MRKKIGFAVAAVIMCCVTLFATACGGISIPKGDGVTEEVWKQAFDRLGEVENYTLNISNDYKLKVDGTLKRRNYDTDKMEDVEISEKEAGSFSMTILNDIKNDKYYSESKRTQKNTSETDGEKEFYNTQRVYKSYYELSEKKDDIKYYWNARYSLNKGESESYKTGEEYYWDAYEISGPISPDGYSLITYFYDSDDEDKATASNIADLIDKFTYSNGVYTATLYQRVALTSDVDVLVKCQVKVSIDGGNRCIIGYSVESDSKETASEKDEYELKYTYKMKQSLAVKNINKTDASKKVKGDLKKALNKKKAEKEKNKNK